MATAPLKIVYDGHEAEHVYARSCQHWQKALTEAKSLPGAIAPESLNVKCILHRTPCLPSWIPSDVDHISGFTKWQSTSSRCRRETKQEPEEEHFYLRQKHHVTCTVSTSQGFAHWDGTPHNGVALLALGWAYVFSASLAARQGLSMEYGVPRHDESSSLPQAMICLDYATSEERMWWKAITTPGIGWSIVGGQISPWGVNVGDIGLAIAGGSDDDDDGSASALPPPPTARQAAQYLARLCAVYRLGRQCSAALAAVLVFPLHASSFFRKAARISLPQPRLPAKVSIDACNACPADGSLPDEFEHLGYYMALSISPFTLGPCLWSAFWAPDVPCHLAGAWIQPAVSVLRPILEGDAANLELLAKVLSFTRAAPLWLGVALCGWVSIVRNLLRYLTTLYPLPRTSPSMTAAAWTGLPNSFLDIQPPIRTVEDGMVPRAEVWRLRHDFYTKYSEDAFKFPPLQAWTPFGEMREEDVELKIRGHLACQHRWEYQSWTWLLGKTVRVVDAGFITEPLEPVQATQRHAAPAAPAARQDEQQQQRHRIPEAELDIIRTTSKQVTESVFWWTSSEVERGFGGTVVKRFSMHGRVEAPRSSERSSRMDDDMIASIHKWLREVDTNGLVQ